MAKGRVRAERERKELKTCPEHVQITAWIEPGGEDAMVVARREDGEFLGSATLVVRSGRVSYIRVPNQEFRRCGIATKIYEAASKFACDVLNKPLRSDSIRSAEADGFWKKQEQKGRVTRVIDREGWAGREVDHYTFSCPPPRSLR